MATTLEPVALSRPTDGSNLILDSFGELNWLAIVVATIAWFAFSAIWY